MMCSPDPVKSDGARGEPAFPGTSFAGRRTSVRFHAVVRRDPLDSGLLEGEVRVRTLVVALTVVFALVLPFSASSQTQSALPEVPVKGMVTMVDLGANKCIPCKMMAPILEDVRNEYQGKAAIVFIDVWQHTVEAHKYRIQAIPTQIFFDKQRNEIFRHLGFMDKKSIVHALEKLGVK
jgi:thioredoxin